MRKILIITLILCVALHGLRLHASECLGEMVIKPEMLVKGSAIKPGDKLIYGFGVKLKGTDSKYQFPIAGIKKALLIESSDGKEFMEWQTDTIPSDIGNADFVNVVFPVGCSTQGIFKHYLSINGKQAFVFENREVKGWEIKNPDGMTLTYESIFADANRDQRGYMYLRIPKSELLETGKPLILKVVAEKCGTSTWFRLYIDRIVASKHIMFSPVVLNNKQQFIIDIIHLAPITKAVFKIDKKTVGSKLLGYGFNRFTLDMVALKKQKTVIVDIVTKEGTTSTVVDIKPSNCQTVNFVEHTHTDIGYTRPQNEILAEHMRYIDYALDYCDETDNLPDNAKFRWTCEASFAVEQFLLTRPQEQIDRFKRRIKEGRIEVSAMFFNLTELPDEQTLVSSLKPLQACRKAGIGSEIALQNDVNGVAWALSDYLPSLGVKYLNMGTHGHRALICFDKPTVFRWQSPSGSEMIAYRAEHYTFGNFLGIVRPSFKAFEESLVNYLNDLYTKGYSYNIASIQFSGYTTDNAPPSITACEHVRKWNEKYTFPKLRLAVSSEFLKAVEKQYGSDLPIIKGAWPDWWTDGCGAAAREVAVSRYTHTDIIANQGLLSMAVLKGAKLPKHTWREVDEVNRALLFYDEHTTGYSQSVRQPHAKQSVDQRALKESYSWEAYRRSRTLNETAQGVLQTYTPKAALPSIVVYNTMNWARSGVVKAYIEHGLLPRNCKFRIIDSLTGKEIAAQPLNSRPDGTYWQFWAENIPALGSVQYLIEVYPDTTKNAFIDKKIPAEIENQWYKMTLNAEKGAIGSLVDKELGVELVKPEDKWLMGEFVYERLAERGSMEDYRMGKYMRQGLDKVWYEGMQKGDIYDGYSFCGRTVAGIDVKNGGANYKFEIRMYHKAKLIEFCYTIIKKSVVDPEGVYIAMPFGLKDSKIYVELPGGVMEAGVEQVVGSSNDWNTIQNFVAVRSDKGQIVVVSDEVPLMQFGAINTGRYKAGALPESSNLYSWVMNNYWVTNFNAEQHGEFEWKYFITSMGNNTNKEATRFGWNARIPMPVRILPGGGNSDVKSQNPLLQFASDNLLLVNMQPVEGENAVMLQIREIGGVKSPILTDSSKAVECNALGEELASGDVTTISAKATKFIKVKM